ncbi:hypothetical protein R1flu_025378 [Riccia fluitans]|uniref:Uncharacterized protein n=1 Tax=Riccia fluitans TaxID=41844 RepID=A0ABD1XXK9_9MARC
MGEMGQHGCCSFGAQASCRWGTSAALLVCNGTGRGGTSAVCLGRQGCGLHVVGSRWDGMGTVSLGCRRVFLAWDGTYRGIFGTRAPPYQGMIGWGRERDGLGAALSG